MVKLKKKRRLQVSTLHGITNLDTKDPNMLERGTEGEKKETSFKTPIKSKGKPLHQNTARVLLLGLLVKHFALGTQAITLGHQVVDLFSALQNTLNGLVKHNLCLVELLLDLEDAVGLGRVLVFFEVLAQLGHDESGRASGPAGTRVLGKELVDDLAEELVSNQGGILVVRNDDSAYTLSATVGMECVVLFLDVLSLSWASSLGDRLCEKGHEFAIVVTSESRIRAELLLGDDFVSGLFFVAKDADIMQLHDGGESC